MGNSSTTPKTTDRESIELTADITSSAAASFPMLPQLVSQLLSIIKDGLSSHRDLNAASVATQPTDVEFLVQAGSGMHNIKDKNKLLILYMTNGQKMVFIDISRRC